MWSLHQALSSTSNNRWGRAQIILYWAVSLLPSFSKKMDRVQIMMVCRELAVHAPAKESLRHIWIGRVVPILPRLLAYKRALVASIARFWTFHHPRAYLITWTTYSRYRASTKWRLWMIRSEETSFGISWPDLLAIRSLEIWGLEHYLKLELSLQISFCKDKRFTWRWFTLIHSLLIMACSFRSTQSWRWTNLVIA